MLQGKVQHRFTFIAQLIRLFEYIFCFRIRCQTVRHAWVLSILVGIHANHDIDTPIADVLLPITILRIILGKILIVGLEVVHNVLIPFFTLPHDTRAILAVCLLTDDFDVHVRHQAHEDGFGCRGRTFGHQGIDLGQADIGIGSIQFVLLAIVFLAIFGSEVGIQVGSLLLVVGHVFVVPNLGLEHAFGLHFGFWSEHGSQDFFGKHVSATVIAQVENQFADAFFLELLAHIIQAETRLEGEAGIGQITYFLATAIEYLGRNDRVFVHGFRIHGHCLSCRNKSTVLESTQSYFYRIAIEQLSITFVCNGLAVNFKNHVPSFQSCFFCRTSGIGIKHVGTNCFIIDIIYTFETKAISTRRYAICSTYHF